MGTRNGAARAANGAGKGVALLEDGGLRTKAEVQGSAVAVRRLSPATRPSPVMQIQEDGDNLIPFAKPTWMEEPYTPPLLRVTGCSQPGLYPPEGLPPPEMLCRRKRRRQHLAGMQQGSGSIPARVRAVTYHLEDLRRRQRIINELKKAQWGSSGAAPEPLGLDEDGYGQPSTPRHPDPEERANSPREEDNLLSPGRAQLLWSPWSPLGQEGSCLSRGLSSLASFSTATASRDPVCSRWGMELWSEE
ncbi:protein INCA1 isoform X2 [Phacochoerus africanus]|uniref:protein INCA1 isoform X2 n=1 Tax=Phacochoerus africanus TaxID=41426 RepID=UPI001FD93F2B|nr:protein INCA1 isoform X2 [Phacochoerus africanus]